MAVTPELLIIGAVAAMAALAVIAARRAADRPYDAAEALLSPAERTLLDGLRAALAPDWVVFPRVRLGDVVHVRRRARGKHRQVALRRIADAYVGYVVCEQHSFRVRAVVELGQEGHRNEARRTREQLLDSILSAARLPLVRIAAKESYDAADLRDALLPRLRTQDPDVPLRPETPVAPGPIGVVVRGMPGSADLRAWLVALGGTAGTRVRRELPGTRTVVALAAGGLVLLVGAIWLLKSGPSSRPPPAKPIAAQGAAPAGSAGPSLRETLDSLLRRQVGDKPKAPAVAPTPAKPPTAGTAPAELPREIVGWREEKVPGKPLEQCLGPDHEINPEVVRCRTGYTQRVPVYR